MFIKKENMKMLNKHKVLIIDNTKVLPFCFSLFAFGLIHFFFKKDR
jgi:hypothetical protein